MPLRNLLTIFLASVISLACYVKADRNRYASALAQAMNMIDAHYLDEVSYRQLYENAMRGMAEGLDQYSAYISPTEKERFLEGLEQEFGGIGILVEMDRETERLMVMSPLVDTPAYRAGIKAGDVILKVDDQDTTGMKLEDAVKLMRGKPGALVRLTVRHLGEDEPVEVEITRDIIPIESVLGDRRGKDGTWDFVLDENPRITYVRLITFGEHTVEELMETLKDREVDALVLDLRDNAGGLLTAAVDVCDLFIENGVIVSTRERGGKMHRAPATAKSETIIDCDVPMVVLTNRFSASASEIVAACLQDHDRAKIIGQRTWGKGTVQNIIEMEGGDAALKLTTASYWRPSGKNIHRRKDASDEDDWGVRPDDGFEIILTDEEAQEVRSYRRQRDAFLNGEREDSTAKPKEEGADEPLQDPQLHKAIEYLEEQLRLKDKMAVEPA